MITRILHAVVTVEEEDDEELFFVNYNVVH